MIDIFIPSYHRPKQIRTAKYFKRMGYDMQFVHIFCDDMAGDLEQYEQSCEELGCKLHLFSLEEARHRYDFVHRANESRRTAGLCRNMFFDWAKANGVEFYVVIDDDSLYYGLYGYGKYQRVAKDYTEFLLVFKRVKEFMNKRHIGCFGLTQTRDIIGGSTNKLLRWRVMNTTFVDTRFMYRGERGVLDTDTSQFVNMYNEGLFTGSLGCGMVLKQHISAVQKGGLTDLYHECKLLAKSLVCPIQFPSAIYAEYQVKNGGRLHHHIESRYLIPKLIKGKRDNIAWDTYPEDVPFTLEPTNRTWDFD